MPCRNVAYAFCSDVPRHKLDAARQNSGLSNQTSAQEFIAWPLRQIFLPRHGSAILDMDIMDRDIGQTEALRYKEVNSGGPAGCQATKPNTDQHRPELARPVATEWTPEQWLRGLLVPVLEEPS
jgi:hypothetical protein